jgi:hypothetical protein
MVYPVMTHAVKTRSTRKCGVQRTHPPYDPATKTIEQRFQHTVLASQQLFDLEMSDLIRLTDGN